MPIPAGRSRPFRSSTRSPFPPSAERVRPHPCRNRESASRWDAVVGDAGNLHIAVGAGDLQIYVTASRRCVHHGVGPSPDSSFVPIWCDIASLPNSPRRLHFKPTDRHARHRVTIAPCEVLGRLYLVMIGIAPDRRRRTQDCHRRLDRARRYRLRGVAVEKVRLDRASGGGRRVEMTIVHELVEFGTIPGNAQTF
jgi:hypothetical protein